MAVLDLFSGCVELRKAGAPVTILRQGGQANASTPLRCPVGILNDAHFAKADAVLRDGDLVVLLSDGALAARGRLAVRDGGTVARPFAAGLAEELVAEAVARRSDGHDDDVTVLVLRMTTPSQSPRTRTKKRPGKKD